MKQTKTVIIADDDEQIRKGIREQLKDSAYRIIAEASDGLTLVRLCKEHTPDVVIADIQMPTMNGMEAVRQIMDEGLTRCAIMLTSYSDAFFVQESVEAGVMEYLTKPTDLNLLTVVLDGAMEKSKELYLKRKEMNKLTRRKNAQSLLDTAKLLLMENKGMSEEEAYEFMKDFAKKRQITLEEVARIIVAKMRKL